VTATVAVNADDGAQNPLPMTAKILAMAVMMLAMMMIPAMTAMILAMAVMMLAMMMILAMTVMILAMAVMMLAMMMILASPAAAASDAVRESRRWHAESAADDGHRHFQ
jgi:hypothetical protein